MALITAALAMGLAPVEAQVADYYRGRVVNAGVADQPATLEFSVFERNDSQTVGWLQVGAPLGGSGMAAVLEGDLDSLYIVSSSQAGDTIVWASETRTGTIGGRYWISGGSYAGQGGTWRLEPHQRLPAVTLALVALFMAVAVVLIIYMIAAYSSDRWWKWQVARPMQGVTDAQLRDWRSIGGWLGWFIVTSCILLVVLLARAGEIGESLGPGWMIGVALPRTRPLLLIESAGHLFQLLGAGLGLALAIRKSPMCPPYWVALLAAMACYAVYDIAASAPLLSSYRSAFGAELAAEFQREVQTAASQNVRLILSATVWSLYWLRSRRVRVAFSPDEAAFRPIPLFPSRGIGSAAPGSIQQAPPDGGTS